MTNTEILFEWFKKWVEENLSDLPDKEEKLKGIDLTIVSTWVEIVPPEKLPKLYGDLFVDNCLSKLPEREADTLETVITMTCIRLGIDRDAEGDDGMADDG